MPSSNQVYQVSVEVFEGPLDLLLQLIQRRELDITTVALARVTDQYLDYVNHLEEIDPGALAEFLVVAAKLLLIKSRALLPQPAPLEEEDEEDPAEELARRLIEYRRFKMAAEGLRTREARGLRAYVRLATPPSPMPSFDLEGVSLSDLMVAFRQALVHHPASAVSEDVAPFTISIDDQIVAIMDKVSEVGQLSFSRFLAAATSRLEIIVSFLALLELIKQTRVVVRQVELFGEIIIECREARGEEPQTLADLMPEGMFVGTSLILRQGGRLLYGIRPPRTEGSRQLIELTGIGGGMEEGDESLTAGVQREAQEEMGCGVRLLPCRQTVVVRGPDRVERVALEGEERPAAVVFRGYRTPPHQPWHADNPSTGSGQRQGEACLVVFLAGLDGEPWPAMELPALIWLRPSHVLDTARRDVPLRQLLDSGAELVEGDSGSLPETAWARLTDSQEALALALGDDALSFYQGLVEE